MKANEIRLGNLIQTNETHWETEFQHKHKLVDLNTFCHLAITECSRYEGIPLTYSLVCDLLDFEPYHENPRLEYFFVNKQGYYPFHICQHRDHTFWFNEHLQIKYVHQLQNIYFALTGEELIISTNER